MKRRFNYTGRQRIPNELVSVVLLPPNEDGVRQFDLRLGSLAELGLPADARVYVEPYVKSSSMRFSFGTVSSLHSPQDRGLSEIDEGAGVLFRVLIVEETDKVARILAMADRVAPQGDELQRDALLPLVTEDLREAVWRLDAVPGSRPRLLINSRYPGLKQKLKTDPLLMGAILPNALREALRFAVNEGDGDEADWVIKWKKFVTDIAGEACTERLFEDDPSTEQIEEDIALVCDHLIDRRRYLSRALDNTRAHSDA